MKSESMSHPHQTALPWEWLLEPGTVTTLPAASLLRWVEVGEGEVWLTGGSPGTQAVDVWLQAGQRHALPAGTQWVLEGWPMARLTLLEGRPAAAGGLLARLRLGWRAPGPGGVHDAGPCPA